MATVSETRREDGLTVVRLAGGLTCDGVVPVTRPFETATQAGGVVVNLADVSLVTTPGISLLLAVHQRLSHGGGRLVLAAVPKSLADVLHRCRLDRVFAFAPDEAGARTLLQAGTPSPAVCYLTRSARPAGYDLPAPAFGVARRLRSDNGGRGV